MSLERRAQSIIAGYLWERAKIHNDEWQAAWERANPGAFERVMVSHLRERPDLVAEKEWRYIKAILLYFVETPEVSSIIANDIDLLGHILRIADLDASKRNAHVDFRQADQQLLNILGVTGHLVPRTADEYFSSIGGLWHLIRADTVNYEDEFNVSLLCIKPLRYARPRPDGGVEVVVSALPHFSLRSRGRSSAELQEFRGVVIEIDSIIYFLATRDGSSPRACLMAWSKPGASKGVVAPHAAHADGIIMTLDGRGDPVATPVVAQFVERDDETQIWNHPYAGEYAEAALRGSRSTPTKEELAAAKFWEEQLDKKGSIRVQRYKKTHLIDSLRRFNSTVDISALIDILNDKRTLGRRGYFQM